MAIYKGAARRLDDIDLPATGSEIGVGEDVIHALIEVETRGTGFDKQGRVIMLFEPHRFYANLHGDERKAAVAQGLAYPKWGTRSYPRDSYPRLEAAMKINEEAALKSCSWGMGQVMGENFKMLNYFSVREMVAAFAEDEEAHLRGMVDFIRKAGIADELRRIQQKLSRGDKVTAADWVPVVRVYNGPGYLKNNYHVRAAAALSRWLRIKDTPWAGMQTLKSMAAEEEAEHEALSSFSAEAPASPLDEAGDGEVLQYDETEGVRATPPPPPAPAPSSNLAPAQEIPAIPPLPVNVPPWVKRLVTWGAGLNIAGVGGAFTFLRDNPQQLGLILTLLKYTAVGVVAAAILIALGILVMKMYHAKLANDLNIARLGNYADRETRNVDFKGWKTSGEEVVSNDSNVS